EQLMDAAEIHRPEALADRLDHLDRDDVIELARRIAVVAQLETRPVVETALERARLREGQLRRRQREPVHVAAVLGGGDLGKPAPAAADLENGLARAGIEPVEDAPILAPLGLG